MNGAAAGGYPPAPHALPYPPPQHFHQLIARNITGNGTDPSSPAQHSPSYKYIGLALAIASGLFIGVSFVLKKMGLLKANAKYNEEAGEGYGYLKNFWWWAGMILMILGEVCNFAAYLFADALLVTPLGALSVVVTAILSSIFLKERLSFVGKIGCFNCIVGAVVIAANAPTQPSVSTIQDMKKLALSPGFLVFAGIIIAGCIFVALWVAPRYAKKSMMVYLTVCSLIGGLSVVSIQGIGAAITAQSRGIPQFNQWFLYIVIVFVVVTLVTEIIYLNKALNLYNAALVTPTYYVFFTSATIVSGAVLYQGFKGTPIQILTVVLGFLQICSGVVLLQFSKSAKDVPDTAILTSDLDQVRTVAEQEEPEYEPRADTMRGTAALLRAISTRRQKRETKEVQRLRDEYMMPIGENENYEFDGIRRRRTMSSGNPATPNLTRRKTVHPPLGMSHFPKEDEDEEEDTNAQPNFWSSLRRKSTKPASAPSQISSVPMNTLSKSLPVPPVEEVSPPTTPKNSTKPASVRQVQPSGTGSSNFLQQDTTYTGAGGDGQIHWSPTSSIPDVSKLPKTSSTPGSPEQQHRQFSFTNVFKRAGSPSNADQPTRPLTSRSGLSFTRRSHASAHGSTIGGTEEERLGLVRGDNAQDGPESPYRDQGGEKGDSGVIGTMAPVYQLGTVVRKAGEPNSDGIDEEVDEKDINEKDIEKGIPHVPESDEKKD